MHIELSKEEIENLSPSEKHVVLNSLQDVKRNSDLVEEYLTEASHGESDETMSITCGDFFKVVEYYQGNLCIACSCHPSVKSSTATVSARYINPTRTLTRQKRTTTPTRAAQR